jgi:hypothetical protein
VGFLVYQPVGSGKLAISLVSKLRNEELKKRKIVISVLKES